MVTGLAVPWYVHPVADPEAWQALPGLARPDRVAPVTAVVVNVSDGPGRSPDPDYLRALPTLAGVPLLGYVDAGYGERLIGDILRDARNWRDWYGIDGVLLDQVPATFSRRGLMSVLVGQLRAGGATPVWGNPGVGVGRDLAMLMDVTCQFEDSYQEFCARTGTGSLSFSDPARAWLLVHSCPDQEAVDRVGRWATAHRVGHLFATRSGLPNPYCGLT